MCYYMHICICTQISANIFSSNSNYLKKSLSWVSAKHVNSLDDGLDQNSQSWYKSANTLCVQKSEGVRWKVLRRSASKYLQTDGCKRFRTLLTHGSIPLSPDINCCCRISLDALRKEMWVCDHYCVMAGGGRDIQILSGDKSRFDTPTIRFGNGTYAFIFFVYLFLMGFGVAAAIRLWKINGAAKILAA